MTSEVRISVCRAVDCDGICVHPHGMAEYYTPTGKHLESEMPLMHHFRQESERQEHLKCILVLVFISERILT